jgi:hypothetical protein
MTLETQRIIGVHMPTPSKLFFILLLYFENPASRDFNLP